MVPNHTRYQLRYASITVILYIQIPFQSNVFLFIIAYFEK